MEAVKKDTPQGICVYLSGAIDETASFDQKIGPVSSALQVNCKGVSRINSIGVKSWVRYFSNLRKNGVKLKFVECSSAVIQQLEFFQNFIEPEEVDSLGVPLFCSSCRKNEERYFTVKELKASSFEVPAVKCSCGGNLVFDDTEEYFQALMG